MPRLHLPPETHPAARIGWPRATVRVAPAMALTTESGVLPGTVVG